MGIPKIGAGWERVRAIIQTGWLGGSMLELRERYRASLPRRSCLCRLQRIRPSPWPHPPGTEDGEEQRWRTG